VKGAIVAAIQEPMRSVADFPTYIPKWAFQLILRMGQFEVGKMYDITVMIPEGGIEPIWVIKGSAKMEGGK
jgi:hypothetical protein